MYEGCFRTCRWLPGFWLAPLDCVHLVEHALRSRALLGVGRQRQRRVLRAPEGHRRTQRLRSHHHHHPDSCSSSPPKKQMDWTGSRKSSSPTLGRLCAACAAVGRSALFRLNVPRAFGELHPPTAPRRGGTWESSHAGAEGREGPSRHACTSIYRTVCNTCEANSQYSNICISILPPATFSLKGYGGLPKWNSSRGVGWIYLQWAIMVEAS